MKKNDGITIFGIKNENDSNSLNTPIYDYLLDIKFLEDNNYHNPENRQMINNIGQDNENPFMKALYEGIEVNNNKLNSKDKDNNDDNDNKRI